MLSDGTEREVPTAEEQKEYLAAKEEVEKLKPLSEQFDKLKATIDLKEGEDISEKMKELKESANPNWQKARGVIKTLKEIAREKGVEVDDDGNVIKKQESLTAEEVRKLAADTYAAGSIDAKKKDVLSKFNEDEAKSIGDLFDKLQAAGNNFDVNMEAAINVIVPNRVDIFKKAITRGGGGGPRVNIKTDGQVSQEAKTLGMSALGLTEEDFARVK